MTRSQTRDGTPTMTAVSANTWLSTPCAGRVPPLDAGKAKHWNFGAPRGGPGSLTPTASLARRPRAGHGESPDEPPPTWRPARLRAVPPAQPPRKPPRLPRRCVSRSHSALSRLLGRRRWCLAVCRLSRCHGKDLHLTVAPRADAQCAAVALQSGARGCGSEPFANG